MKAVGSLSEEISKLNLGSKLQEALSEAVTCLDDLQLETFLGTDIFYNLYLYHSSKQLCERPVTL